MSAADSGLIRFRTHFRRQARRDAEQRLRRDPYAALACEAQMGDREALTQLIRVLAPRLRGAVRAVYGGEHADVDDVLQEALLSFLKALPAFEGRSTVLHYAYRITVRTGLLARRRTRRRLDRVELHDSPELVAEGVDADPLAEQRRDVLRSLLDELPEEQAETMAMRVCLGMSLEEVSEATDAPVNTVRSRVRLARQALRRRLEDDPDAHELLEGWV
jgi:RNA polymerase sigma-70 factor (ECF subfamily)